MQSVFKSHWNTVKNSSWKDRAEFSKNFLAIAGLFTLAFTMITYLSECQARRDQGDLAAWQIIVSAQNLPIDGGRSLAFKKLNGHHWKLARVNAPAVYLDKLELDSADFNLSHFNAAIFNKAVLRLCNFSQASLSRGGLLVPACFV